MRNKTLVILFMLLGLAFQVVGQRTRINPEILKAGSNSTYFGTNGSGSNGSYTIAETDIADGSIFPRLSASETVNGLWTLVNPILKDAGTYFSDDGDATKLFRFQASGVSTGTTRNFTVPNTDGTLALTGDLISGMTGDVTLSGFSGSVTSTIGTNVVSNSKFRQSAGLSVVGTTGNSTANVADITAGTDHQVLRRSGTALAFGAVNLAQSAAVTGVLPATNGGNVATNFPITTRTLPTTVGGTVELGALSHNSGNRDIFVQLDLTCLSGTGRSGSKRYYIPLSFNSAASGWVRVPPIASLGPASSRDFELEIRTNTSGSPSGGIDTFRVVTTQGTTSGTIYSTLQVFNPSVATISFTETSNTSTSSVATTAAGVFSYASLSQQGRRVGVNVVAPTVTLDVESPSSHTTAVARWANSTTSFQHYITNASPEGVITAAVGSVANSSGGELYLKELNSSANGWYRVVTESFSPRNYSFTRTMPTTINQTEKLGYINWSHQNSGRYMEVVIHTNGSDNSCDRYYVITGVYQSTGGAWHIVPSIAGSGAYSSNMDFQLEIKSVNHVDSLRVRRTLGTSASTMNVFVTLKAFAATTVFVPQSGTESPATISTWYTYGTINQHGSSASYGGAPVSSYKFANYGAFTAEGGVLRSKGSGSASVTTGASLFLENSAGGSANKWTLTSTDAGHLRTYINNTLLTTQIRGSNLEMRHWGTGLFGAGTTTIEGAGLVFADTTTADAVTGAENKLANSSADAVLYAKTAASGGDAKVKLHVGSVLWTLGSDASDGGRVKLAPSDDPGSGTVFSIGSNDIQLNKQVFSNQFALTDGATIAVDFNNSNSQRVTLGGNRTITFANPKAGAVYRLFLKQDGTGSRTVTWPTVKWQGGTTPTLTTTAGKTDIITITYDGTDYFGSAQLNH